MPSGNMLRSLLLLALAGCSGEERDAAATVGDSGKAPTVMKTLTGEVLYRERIKLEPGAELLVQLLDVSRMDVAADVLASTLLPANAGPPYAFSISYDARQIDERHTYAVSARIEANGQLIFINDTQHRAIFDDKPLQILVVRVGGGNDLGRSMLAGTYWHLEAIAGQPVEQGANSQRVSLQFDESTASGFSGCNRFSGAYAINNGTLTLGPMASTRMACDRGMDLEARLLTAFAAVRGYQLEGDRMTLLGDTDVATLSFVSATRPER
jgi:putative lipoprotein